MVTLLGVTAKRSRSAAVSEGQQGRHRLFKQASWRHGGFFPKIERKDLQTTECLLFT